MTSPIDGFRTALPSLKTAPDVRAFLARKADDIQSPAFNCSGRLFILVIAFTLLAGMLRPEASSFPGAHSDEIQFVPSVFRPARAGEQHQGPPEQAPGEGHVLAGPRAAR